MKKTYIVPSMECMEVSTEDTLLSASAADLPTTLFDDETAGGDESLTRIYINDVWDEDF